MGGSAGRHPGGNRCCRVSGLWPVQQLERARASRATPLTLYGRGLPPSFRVRSSTGEFRTHSPRSCELKERWDSTRGSERRSLSPCRISPYPTASMGFGATLLCGAASGGLSATVTFPFDTVRRRMQIQSLHVEKSQRSGGLATFIGIAKKDGIRGLYRGIAPELLKVVPMVGTMFLVYERLKDTLVV